MGFGIFEISRNRGTPIELYRFRYGVFDTDAHCYTNAEQPQTHLGQVYTSLPIKRGKIVSSSEGSSKSSLDIDLPGSAAVCEMFRVSAPPGAVTLTIFQGHATDPDNEFIAMWTGKVTGCSWEEDGNRGKLMCEPVKGQMRRLSLRRHFQYMCPHVLYGDQCRASKAAATTVSVLSAADGRTVTVPALLPSPERYAGGILEWDAPGGMTSARTILRAEHVAGSTRLILSGVDAALVAGLRVRCVLGCSHEIGGCLLHNNVPNYGGQRFIPTSNPLGINGAFS